MQTANLSRVAPITRTGIGQRSIMLAEISKEQFLSRYRLGKQVSQQGARSFEAHDAADRMLLVHFLGPVGSPEADRWTSALSALAPEGRSGLVGAFLIDNEAVLVTAYLPQIRSFADWFVSVAEEQTVADETSPVMRPDIVYDGPSVLTRALGAEPEPTVEPSPPAESPTRAGGPGPGQDAGEFTRMFGGLSDEAATTPAERPRAGQVEPTPDSRVVPSDEPDKQGGEFTEFFGPTEKSDSDLRQDDTPKQTDEERPTKPRIVWRDRTPKEAPPEPGQPGIKVRWEDSPRGEEEVKPPVPPQAPSDPRPEQPPSAPSRQEPAPPPSPAPASPPGQFTEIFGEALSPDSQPGPPNEPVPSDREIAQPEPPMFDTGPRKSVSEQVAPLPDRASGDYLRALGSDSHVEPPPAAAAPEAVGNQLDYSPDLPPPVNRPPPQPAGPSDYTQIVAGRPVEQQQGLTPPPAPAPAPRPAAESGEPAPAKAPTWLWVSLAAIAVVMVLLIVLVVLT